VVGAATRGAVGWVATLVRVLGLLIAAILVIHILIPSPPTRSTPLPGSSGTARRPFRWDWPACLLRPIKSSRWECTTVSRR
jgi:hypothetical protein